MVAAQAQLRFYSLSKHPFRVPDPRNACLHSSTRHSISFPSASSPTNRSLKIQVCGGNGSSGGGFGHGKGGSGDNGDQGDSWRQEDGGISAIFLSGWRSRVSADPAFPFKVVMEELIGVSACVLGDMASRPNFGMNELDFVFSTLVVGSIMNFVLMYLLAPTAAASASSLPAFFSGCPTSHMFESGSFTLLNRVGTLVYKGAVFGVVGFAAGLVGTAISNGLLKIRKKMDPGFETPNKAPPTLLNAGTWAIHMGASSNLRYQCLNGVEFLLAKGAPPLVFKISVLVLRLLNNVAGGVSFVMLARLTGSQSATDAAAVVEVGEKERKLLNDAHHLSITREMKDDIVDDPTSK